MLKKLINRLWPPLGPLPPEPLARTREPVQVRPPVPPVPPREANDDWLRPGSPW